MIYLTFDSNIWIYLLDDSWKESNPLDYLEHWIERGLVTILLPEIIITEWDKHREEEKEKRKRLLKDFFFMAEELIPAAFWSDLKKPEKVEEIIEDQIRRIENLIKSKATTIKLDDETKMKLIDWGVSRKAPLHKKSSMADAIIALSLIKFANENSSDEYFFVSGNTDDFYLKEEGKQQIHPHLKEDFANAKIQDCRHLNTLLQRLKETLPVTIDIEAVRKARARNKVKSEIYNPALVKSLDGFQDVFFENTKHIDFILSSNSPTKQQILSIWALIDSDQSYRQYFFDKVSKPLWFSILQTRDAFSPECIPDAIPFGRGFQTPYWEVLRFLEKLSLQIKEGRSMELADEVLAVIKNVSEHPKNNYRVWYIFLRILNNLPNDKVTNEILQFIPLWLTGDSNSSLASGEICDHLLSKFLCDAPSREDIEKGELILRYLFQIEKKDIVLTDVFNPEKTSYYSRVHLSDLTDILLKKKLIVKVVQYCNADFILDLGRTIKYLLLDYPNGINTRIKNGESEFEIKALIEKENLIISSKLKDSENPSRISLLPNFEDYNEEELKAGLIQALKEQGISYTPSDRDLDTFKMISYSINNDFNSVTGFNAIRKLGDRYYNNEKVLSVFALIFRELLIELAKQNPAKAISYLNSICYDKKYRIPFFKRVALFVVSELWDQTKPVFWDLIKNRDESHIFSNHKYRKELYDVLNKSQSFLSSSEKEILQSIIEQGDQDNSREKGENHLEYWQLQWYSALRNTEPFLSRYQELSKKLNIKHDHYENLGELRLRSGSITPVAKSDLLEKTNAEIANFLKTFQPKDRWEEPNISGLSDTLEASVVENPEKFANEIELYNEVAYIYSYHMLNAFSEAWKKKKTFDWERVLSYCLAYINDPKFYAGHLKAENDGWNANADWVVGSIAYLLTNGMQNDNHAFDMKLMPLAKQIIQILVRNLKRVEDFEERNMDYVMYSFNSTAGKVLRALFDYSLRKGRMDFKKDDIKKWEPEMKALFEETLEKEILDGHIMMGLYFEQFYFLDRGWIIEQAKKHYTIEEKKWLPFVNGYVLGNALSSKELYDLLYPHFDKVIESKMEVKRFDNHGLVRHLTAFYFWGFETLTDKKLLWKFLNAKGPEQVVELVNFIWQQEDYVKSLTRQERMHFDKIILDLWKFLIAKFGKSEDESEHKVLAALCNWLVFAPELNDTYANLILKSCRYKHKTYSTHELIENLVAIKNVGDPAVVARNIGRVISAMNFSEHISDDDQKNIKTLIIFISANGQRKTAVEFCNKMASLYGQYFLRDLHDKNFESDDSDPVSPGD